jgi:hypothetical protein
VAGESVQLSAKEYELLVTLAEDPSESCATEELVRNVWGFRAPSVAADYPQAPHRTRLAERWVDGRGKEAICHFAAVRASESGAEVARLQ